MNAAKVIKFPHFTQNLTFFMKRLFAAIKIHPSPKYISTFNELTTSLKHERIKWVEPENMHLTLKFFGETEENKIADIQLALSNAVSKSRTFTLKFSDTGIFGSRYDPRVVWFGIKPGTRDAL